MDTPELRALKAKLDREYQEECKKHHFDYEDPDKLKKMYAKADRANEAKAGMKGTTLFIAVICCMIGYVLGGFLGILIGGVVGFILSVKWEERLNKPGETLKAAEDAYTSNRKALREKYDKIYNEAYAKASKEMIAKLRGEYITSEQVNRLVDNIYGHVRTSIARSDRASSTAVVKSYARVIVESHKVTVWFKPLTSPVDDIKIYELQALPDAEHRIALTQAIKKLLQLKLTENITKDPFCKADSLPPKFTFSGDDHTIYIDYSVPNPDYLSSL